MVEHGLSFIVIRLLLISNGTKEVPNIEIADN
jgi:hypothetical protein